MNKRLYTLLAAAAIVTARADVTIYQTGYGPHATTVIHTEFKHVPLTDPSEPYHETYRKNLGKKDQPKEVRNVPAKREAEMADSLRYAEKAARVNRPTISVYSNATNKSSRPQVNEPKRGA